jgi:hypothetical protein
MWQHVLDEGALLLLLIFQNTPHTYYFILNFLTSFWTEVRTRMYATPDESPYFK